MKATGIVRRIDDLGRIVIPKEIRRTLRIHEGDSLEIYTDSDGMVIFKKYSPIGELSEFALQCADTLNKSTGLLTCITDKDSVIAASGKGRKELKERRVSEAVEKIMEKKSLFFTEQNDEKISIIDDSDKYKAGVVAPIVHDGDPVGTVIFIAEPDKNMNELEQKLAETAAGFLGKALE
ncbi:MAG TPA: AbrB/MazE/SpoVT family DNA-binding domain-containing protein [Candidatus Monoglobus merdigallinarum]|uniref:AbrB/MazE/SpoVT family DNA-binding domain-containing protein n=1 Tax=Candidatus Monoglobus merdigallinarum TaxID=2838698 RepID=A0A9D1TLG0_9FIRM|nr:AbrB/MazE/SpoVT family DNA-binding domain-containing protein [Candidatus Monoglobus merdigallinarum]